MHANFTSANGNWRNGRRCFVRARGNWATNESGGVAAVRRAGSIEIARGVAAGAEDDEVLFRVIAAGVNPVDAYVRQGRLSERGFDKRPMIIGYDIAGVVEKIGAKITKFKV